MLLGPSEPLEWLRHVTPDQVKTYYWAAQEIYLNPWFWIFTASILVFEKLLPADKEQAALSRGLFQDFLWFNADAMLKVALLPASIGLLRVLYDSVTGGWHFTFMDTWPLGMAILVLFFLFDFLQWFHHWVRHRVTGFWHFHAVHHSQRQMNLFTDFRVHIGDYVVADFLVFIPLFAFNIPAYAIVGVASVRWWYTRFIHANIRTNLGFGKYFMVTPQSHRVHHSIEPGHRDKNFGVVFSIWDRMFGTLHRNYDEYPATGLDEVAFEPPAGASLRAWVLNFWQMLVYPFARIRQSLAGDTPRRG